MAKIPIILEAGRADGKLIKTNSIYDDNQEKFLSNKIKEIDDNHNSLTDEVNVLKEVVNNNELDIENKLEEEQNRATNVENNLRETVNNITEISGSATAAKAVTIDTIPNSSSSNVQQALNELFNADDGLNTAIEDEKKRAEAAEEMIIFDVSAHNNGAVFESLSALLSDSNLNTLIPTSVRYGGMTIRFIQGYEQSSDNKYVQFRYIGIDTIGTPNPFTNTANWQGVDDKPTAGSDNLVKSSGVFSKLSDLSTSINKINGGEVDLSSIIVLNKYYPGTATGVGVTVDTTLADSTSWCCAMTPVKKGDIIKISGHAGGPRLWCLTDKKYLCKALSDNGYSTDNIIEVNVENDGYGFFNFLTISGYTHSLSIIVQSPIMENTKNISQNTLEIKNLKSSTNKMVNGLTDTKGLTLNDTIFSDLTMLNANKAYIDNNGELVENDGIYTTNLIPINQLIGKHVFNLYYASSTGWWKSLALYDKEGSFIRGSEETYIAFDKDWLNINKDVFYVRFCYINFPKLGYIENTNYTSVSFSYSLTTENNEFNKYFFAPKGTRIKVRVNNWTNAPSATGASMAITIKYWDSTKQQDLVVFTKNGEYSDIALNDIFGLSIIATYVDNAGSADVEVVVDKVDDLSDVVKTIVNGKNIFDRFGYINGNGTVISTNVTEYYTTDYLKVEDFRNVTFSNLFANTYTYAIFFYNKNKEKIDGINSSIAEDYISVTLSDEVLSKYPSAIYMKLCRKLRSVGIYDNDWSKTKLSVPKNIYCAIGETLQIFKNSLYDEKYDKNLTLNIAHGNLGLLRTDDVNYVYDGMISVSPNKANSINIRLGLAKEENDNICVSDVIKVISFAKKQSPATPINIMMVGDSFTANNYYPKELIRRITGVDDSTYCDHSENAPTSDNLLNINFNVLATVGWDYDTYMNTDPNRKGQSPFLNPLTEQVSIDYWCNQHNVSKIDVCLITLGTNHMCDNNTIKSFWDLLKQHNPDIKVIVTGRVLNAKQNKASNVNIFAYNRRVEALSLTSQYNTNFHFVDLLPQFDVDYNMQNDEVNANTRNSSVKRRRAVDFTHPNHSGYWQIADIMYSAFHYFAL